MWWGIAWYIDDITKTQGCMALETEAKDELVGALKASGFMVAVQHVVRLSDAEAFVNKARHGWPQVEWQ